MSRLLTIMMALTLVWGLNLHAGELGFQAITNEVSFYQNLFDDGEDAGRTLQIVSINSFKLLTWFSLEFTYDFNRDLAWKGKDDYYYELGLVKPVWKKLSVNYQRVDGTFVEKPFSQIGVRYSF
jgi:hypothetical protein